MKPRAVFFDLFGTLIEVFSLSEYDRVLVAMAATLGVDEGDFRREWHGLGKQRGDGTFQTGQEAVRAVLTTLGQERPDQLVNAATEHRLELCRRWMVPRADVVPTLRALRERGLIVGLISNCAPEIATVWPETAMAPWLDPAILSCSVRARKPDAAIYRTACERAGVEPGDCLYVGDGDDRELEGAAAVGMHPVQIRVPHENAADAFRRHDQPWHGPRIAAIAEVLSLLDG